MNDSMNVNGWNWVEKTGTSVEKLVLFLISLPKRLQMKKMSPGKETKLMAVLHSKCFGALLQSLNTVLV